MAQLYVVEWQLHDNSKDCAVNDDFLPVFNTDLYPSYFNFECEGFPIDGVRDKELDNEITLVASCDYFEEGAKSHDPTKQKRNAELENSIKELIADLYIAEKKPGDALLPYDLTIKIIEY